MAQEQKRRIIFMGTPEFGSIVLEQLYLDNKNYIVGVYCQPDKINKRGNKIDFSPVKNFALKNNLPIYQPKSLKNESEIENLKKLHPDFLIVAAYGMILPQKILDIPKFAPINVHGSLLPEYRGAAPIQRAIKEKFSANAYTGYSIMKMTEGLDEGPVYAQEKILINNKNYQEIAREIAFKSGEALKEILKNIQLQIIEPVIQDNLFATYAHKINKDEIQIDWQKPADQIDAHVRAISPKPGAKTQIFLTGDNKSIEIIVVEGKVIKEYTQHQIGTIVRNQNKIFISCIDGYYELLKIKPINKSVMRAIDFVNGKIKQKTDIIGQIAAF